MGAPDHHAQGDGGHAQRTQHRRGDAVGREDPADGLLRCRLISVVVGRLGLLLVGHGREPSRATMQSAKGDEKGPAIKPSRATMHSPKGDEVGVPPSRAAARGRAGRSDAAWSLSNNGGVTVEAIRSGIDLSYVDAGARPQDDLFGYVNGRWL